MISQSSEKFNLILLPDTLTSSVIATQSHLPGLCPECSDKLNYRRKKKEIKKQIDAAAGGQAQSSAGTRPTILGGDNSYSNS